jgi:hypothetical protein
MKKAQIYKISNTKTDGIYVGSTIQRLKDRFKAHRSNAKLNKRELIFISSSISDRQKLMNYWVIPQRLKRI